MTIQFLEQTINGTVSGTVRDFALSPDGTLIIACTSVDTYLLQYNSATHQWDIVTISGKSGAEPGVAPGFAADSSYVWFQKNAALNTAGTNAYIRWQKVSGVWTENQNTAGATWMRAFKPHSNNQMIALYYDQMYLWTNVQAAPGSLIGPFFTGASAVSPNDAAFSPDYDHIVVTRRNGVPLVYRSAGGWTADTVVGGGSTTGNWRVQWIDNTHFLMSEAEVSTGIYLGTLTSTNTWTITQIDNTFNSYASFVMNDGKLVGYFNSSAAALPELFDFTTGTMVQTTDFTGLPSTQTIIAARSRQTGGGNLVLAIAPSTGGARVFAIDNSLNLNANMTLPLFGSEATLDIEDHLNADMTLPMFGMAASIASVDQEYPPYIPFQMRSATIELQPTMLEQTDEFLPLATIVFSYGAYDMALEMNLIVGAEIEFSYGAYSMEVLEGLRAEIEFSYGAYAMALTADNTLDADIVFSYGAYDMALEGFQPLGMYVNFSYAAYAMEIDGDAQFGARINFSYGAYDMAVEADVSVPTDIDFSYGPYDIAIVADAPVAGFITFSYSAYDMSLFAAQPNSIVFSYGAYSMAIEASAPVVADIRFSYGAYDMALFGNQVTEGEIIFSYGAYGMEIQAEALANNALTFLIIQP